MLSPCPYLHTTINSLLRKIQAQEMEFSIKDMTVIIIPERKQAFRSFRKNLQFQAVLQNIRHSSLMHQATQHPNYTNLVPLKKKKPKPETSHRSKN